MHDDSSTTASTARPRNGVLALNGYGIRVAVERGHLIVEDGRGKERRQGRFPRTTRDLKRLIVIGHTGTISFDALRWLHDIGCAFVQLDTDGLIIAASALIGSDDARLRRAQVAALGNETGIEISRELLSRKLTGQADVLNNIENTDSTAQDIRRLRDIFASSETLTALRIIESEAASMYWNAWTGVPVRFARKAADRVPDHWKRFGTRTSQLTNSPRTSSTPTNSILNYLYAVAEAETRIALLTIGLDPGLGIVHADQRNRDSFACDVMEAIRPTVDRFVLDFLQSRPFGTGDFFETRQGSCRLMPPITRMLAETAPRWAAAVAPVVEWIAQVLLAGSRMSRPIPTPLTQANRRVGRANVHNRQVRDTYASHQAPLPVACLDCGVILEDSARRYCDACLPDVRKEQEIAFAAAGPAALAARRATGTDPAHGGDAGRSRGRRNAKHYTAAVQWEMKHAPREEVEQPEPEHFTRDILPMLQDIPLSKLADATGLTKGYCSFIRRGQKVPHRRHWKRLVRLAETLSEQVDRT